MTLSRRAVLAGIGGASIALGMPSIIRAQAPRKIRFAFGTSTPNASYMEIVLGNALGFYAEENIEVEALPLGQIQLATLAVDKGDVDFAVGVLSFELPLFAKGELPPITNFMEFVYPFKYDVVVLPGSPIASYKDLKGKTLGVPSLATSGYPATRAVLANIGLDPDNDVTWVAVGDGAAAAGAALQQGVIDALAAWDTVIGTIEGAGIELMTLPRPLKVPLFGGSFAIARQDYLTTNRETMVGFARGVRKSQEFMRSNPQAAVHAFLGLYPELAPRGASTEDAIATLLPVTLRRLPTFLPPLAGVKPGAILPAEFTESADFLGLQVSNTESLFTNELVDEMNDFDIAAVQAQAVAYPIG